MTWKQTAAQLVQMSDSRQRAAIAAMSPQQLVAVSNAALQLRRQVGMQGLGELGFSFGNLFKNLLPALIPFTAMIPGVGPVIAAVGGAVASSITSGGGAAPQQFAPPPPPPTSPQPASGGFTLSPTILIAGVALIVLLKR